MGWEGRQLKSAGKNGTNLSFTYDSEGIRTSKTVGSTTTQYLLNGTQILAQKTGSTTLSFFYDQQGNRVAMADSSNKFYYYIYNVQGDVIALADASTGKLAVTYTYDAWGKILKINGQNPEDVASTNIANINPFRYRGYYYDTETSLYYLQSRYYDPDTGRFISADGQLNGGVLGYNMFAYCENNPINESDPSGDWSLKNAFEKIYNTLKQVANSVEKAAKTTFNSIVMYAEHRKKGTTGEHNRNKHEEGQARKQRDSGKEKGDARRKDHSNKRNKIISITQDTAKKIAGGVIVVAAGAGILYLTLNDATGIGALDDIAIPPAIKIFEYGLTLAGI